ncbi:MAG: AsmA family protein [Caldimonas sp.]
MSDAAIGVPALPPRRMRGRFAIAAMSLLSLVFLAVLSQPLWVAPIVGAQLASTSGRAVHFDSLWVGLSFELAPVVHFRGVRIENAPWADPKRPFADVREAIAVVSWRSVPEQRPVIALLILRDGSIDLERQADGLRNWRLKNPEDRGPGRYKLLALEAHRSTLRFAHRGIDLDLEATATPNADQTSPASGVPLPTHIDLTGEWRELAFKAALVTGEVLTFFETGQTFPLRGRLDAGGASLDLDGRVGDIFRSPIVDATVALTGDALAPFHAFIGPRHDSAARKAFRVEGHLTADQHTVSLSAARVHVGATDLAGEFDYRHDQQRHALRADMRSDLTDVADLAWLAGRAAERAAIAPAAAAAITPHAFDFSRARALDVDLVFAARRLRAAEYPLLQSLRLKGALVDGLLDVSDIDVGVAGAHATGRVALDMRRPRAIVDADVSLRGLRLQTMLPAQAENKRVTGVLHGRVRVKAAGDSGAALLADSSGTATVVLTSGTISSLLDAELGLQGGKILRSMIGGAEPIAIHCAAATVDLQRGAGRVRTLLFDTERTRTTGTGTIDLRDETIDLVLTPEAKQGGLFVLDRSIRLHGPLRKPGHELVDRAAPVAGAGCAH